VDTFVSVCRPIMRRHGRALRASNRNALLFKSESFRTKSL